MQQIIYECGFCKKRYLNSTNSFGKYFQEAGKYLQLEFRIRSDKGHIDICNNCLSLMFKSFSSYLDIILPENCQEIK